MKKRRKEGQNADSEALCEKQRGGVDFSNNVKYAFTLAEVLIALTVVGIVAALTIPTLVSNIQNRAFQTIFKKQYAVFAQAMKYINLDDPTYSFPIISDANISYTMPLYICKIQQYYKVEKSGQICDMVLNPPENFNHLDAHNTKVQWHKSNAWFDKTGKPLMLNIGYVQNTFLTKDNVLINFNCVSKIYIDVNGYSKPNTVGKDIFFFAIGDKGQYFFNEKDEAELNACSVATSHQLITKDDYEDDCENGSGWGCSPLVILGKQH